MSCKFLDLTRRILAYVTFGGGVLNILFWTLYFTNIITLSEENRSLVDRFESAFPLADAVLGVLLLFAGIRV